MLILSLPGHALKNITKACVEDIKSPNSPHTKLWFLLFGLVLVNQLSLDILHQPIKNLHIAVDGDVHLFPTLGLHREVLSKVMHLPDQQFTGTREVLFHWNAHKDEAKFATGFFQTLFTVIFSLQLTSSWGHVKYCFTEMHTRRKQNVCHWLFLTLLTVTFSLQSGCDKKEIFSLSMGQAARLRSTCPKFILTCPDFFLLCAISPLLWLRKGNRLLISSKYRSVKSLNIHYVLLESRVQRYLPSGQVVRETWHKNSLAPGKRTGVLSRLLQLTIHHMLMPPSVLTVFAFITDMNHHIGPKRKKNIVFSFNQEWKKNNIQTMSACS